MPSTIQRVTKPNQPSMRRSTIVNSTVIGILYFSQHGFNSLFFLSDLIFVHGIGTKAGGSELAETQRKLMEQVSAASANLIEFAKAFVAAAWLKHFGAEMVAKDIVTVSDAPNVDEVWLPFFVEVPSGDQLGGPDA